MKYNYFCDCCGTKFTHDLPERNSMGLLNKIVCPDCGAYDIYTDDEKGAKESVSDLTDYENKLILWED